ncbi:Chromosome partition protein Smc [Botrimarina colliarenosi]|uniref:Chromosome partition protein Smc n=1 Tax=Botrimarina colliarenosi TaxID=2528001 RepID=A0A5C6AJQ3_9BACT|nr:hypothetical protein [Botrimarina colliarenosi]TWT99640.1 Chromosome partition protein Smc [Botrimarina colliarenosi]
MSTTTFCVAEAKTGPTPPRDCTDPVLARLGLLGQDGSCVAYLDESAHTIGGGPRCSVRLDGPGLRPLHCVVTPGESGPVVRRWASETRLNGADFSEARLAPGDCLRVGSVDLEVVSIDVIEKTEPTEPAAAVPTTADLPADADLPATAELPVAPTEIGDELVVVSPEVDAPTSLAEVTSEWLDNSVDLLEKARAIDLASGDDPAIPSHLLKPWTPAATASTPPAEEVDDPFRLDEPSPWDALLSTPETSTPEAELPSDPNELNEAAAPRLPGFVEAAPASEESDPWRLEAVTPHPVEPTPSFDPSAAALFSAAAEEKDVVDESLFDSLPVIEESLEEVSAVEDADSVETAAMPAFAADGHAADVARLRQRLSSYRPRVRRMVAALRNERQQADGLGATLAELQERAEQAVAAADEANGETERLAEQLHLSQTKRVDAEAALQNALQRAEELQYRVDDLEAALAEASFALAEQVESSVIAPSPEPLAAPEPSALLEADVVSAPSNAEDEPTDAVWPEQSDSPASSSPWASTETMNAASEPTKSATRYEDAESFIEPAPEATAESLWGIERLGGESEEVAPESLWETSLEASVEAPSDPLESPATLLDLADTAPSEATAETEPQSLAAADGNDSDESAEAPEPGLVAGLVKDPFAAPVRDEAEAAEAPEPESFIDRFAHMVPDEDEPVEAPAPLADPEPTASNGSVEDESIDDYMRKLMQRVRGGSECEPQSLSTPATQQPTRPLAVAPVVAEAQSNAELEVIAPEQLLSDLSEMRREPTRTVTTDMDALRQLANQSARHAIDVAETRTSREKATLRLTVSAVALGCGALSAITAASPFDLQFAGGLTSALGGGWFGFRTLRSCQATDFDTELKAAVHGKRAR